MPELKSERALKARRRLESYASEIMDDVCFMDDVLELVHAVQDEDEDSFLKGRVRFMGRPYMLYRTLHDSAGLERRPVHRGMFIKQITKALDEYLGLKWEPDLKPKKRKRRKLRRALTI